MEYILEAKDLVKKYYNKIALDGVSFKIPKGRVVGLLGTNGSGKTTFIKIVMGLLRQTSGEVLIDGHKPSVYTKSIISYLPDRNYLYKWMRIEDAEEFFKDFYDDFDDKKFEELLEFMKLKKDLKIKELSKGMTEKLSLALVLSRKAKLYVLDEPLGGVDPVAREKILNAIIGNYSEDSSMIITTHLVNDIEKVFSDVIFIKDGSIVLQGDAEELRTERGKSIDQLFVEVYE